MSLTIPRMAPYQGASTCTGSTTQGARALMAFWLEEYGHIGRSLGIYNCRSVRGGSTTSLHGEGRACDLGVPVNDQGHAIMWEFLNRLAPHAYRLGIQYIVFDRKQWSARRDPGGDYYGGTHPHRDHAHVELTWKSARNLTLSTLRAVVGSSEEEDMYVVRFGNQKKDPRVARCQRILQAVGREYLVKDLLPKYGADGYYGSEMRDAVNELADMAKLPKDGDKGMDLLVLDYARHLLTHARREG